MERNSATVFYLHYECISEFGAELGTSGCGGGGIGELSGDDAPESARFENADWGEARFKPGAKSIGAGAA